MACDTPPSPAVLKLHFFCIWKMTDSYFTRGAVNGLSTSQSFAFVRECICTSYTRFFWLTYYVSWSPTNNGCTPIVPYLGANACLPHCVVTSHTTHVLPLSASDIQKPFPQLRANRYFSSEPFSNSCEACTQRFDSQHDYYELGKVRNPVAI